MLEIFEKYMGKGLIVIWFLAALCYLFVKERRRPMRVLFVYSPLAVLLLFFNPLFYRFFASVTQEEIYFRILWLLPIIVVIAYAAVLLCDSRKGRQKYIYAGLLLVLLAISGKLVYSSHLYSKAENTYHVPRMVVDICDAIEVEGREVMAAFPDEFLLYVRQYSPLVCMPYGRDVIMGGYHDLSALINAKEASVEQMATLAKEYGCHYLILNEKQILHGNMADYAYEVFAKMHGYIIYKDTTMNFSVD